MAVLGQLDQRCRELEAMNAQLQVTTARQLRSSTGGQQTTLVPQLGAVICCLHASAGEQLSAARQWGLQVVTSFCAPAPLGVSLQALRSFLAPEGLTSGLISASMLPTTTKSSCAAAEVWLSDA